MEVDIPIQNWIVFYIKCLNMCLGGQTLIFTSLNDCSTIYNFIFNLPDLGDFMRML